WASLAPTVKSTRVDNGANFTPALNISEDENNYFVEAELPGMNKDDINISVKDNSLCLKGTKSTFNEENKENFHHMERAWGAFYRAIPLPNDADVERMGANYEDGLLTVEIAKYTNGHPTGSRRIDIR
ncbi:MAG: Hsp20/alpha crystallin family protein, partial [Flavobacteriaceae bacterium]|nr:Hsp20/alpha crystallin family protein [Flavobacteriaceae bacterium]